jgi:3-dehydroquinate synthase
MKQFLSVDIKNDKSVDYKIEISDDSFLKLKEDVDVITSGKKVLWVVSEKVYKLYAKELNLKDSYIFILKDGEPQKNFKNYSKILEKAYELGLTRSDYLIALGGGVVGDIVGFAASTYMRGISFIQIPTTLLSMVDSSVGGKTGIDLVDGKNIVGTFYQPKKVFININFLKTLDKRQYASGLGEILKYAFIEDNCGYKHSLFFFEHLTLSCEKLLEREPKNLMRVIEYCFNMKTAVVMQDEKEAGLRKILNFGHTFGHALETLGRYKKYTHGEAVVQGMFFIFNWAYSKGYVTYSYYRMAIELLTKYGFKGINVSKLPIEKLLGFMKKDKKASNDKITFIIPTEKKKVKELVLTIDEVRAVF